MTTHVLWVEPDPHWDESLIREWTADDEWQHVRKVPLGEGAIVVIPGQHHLIDAHELAQSIALLPWALTIVTSDEEALFPISALPDDARHETWTQYHAREGAARIIPIGTPPDTQRLGYPNISFPMLDAGERISVLPRDENRDLAISFVGQNTHARREELLDTLKRMAYETGNGNIAWYATAGFAQGLDRDEYLAILARTRLAPCPSGPHSLDSFRLYEALAMGALPIVETHTPHGDEGEFWDALFGPHRLIPRVASWEEALPLLADDYADLGVWRAERDEILAWWQDYRENLERDFRATIQRLRES